MRLQAREDFSYGRKDLRRGEIFDAPDEHGRILINQDKAEPYNLDDPSIIQKQVDFPPWEDPVPQPEPKATTAQKGPPSNVPSSPKK